LITFTVNLFKIPTRIKTNKETKENKNKNKGRRVEGQKKEAKKAKLG
jgi:hypothetical protein